MRKTLPVPMKRLISGLLGLRSIVFWKDSIWNHSLAKALSVRA